MSDLIVSKYGGSSITCAEDVERIRKISSDDSQRKIIVLSAPGISPANKNDKTCKKITDLAIKYSETRDPEIIPIMSRIYNKIYPDVSTMEFNREIGEFAQADLSKKAFEDFFKAYAGERENARNLARKLDADFVDATELFLVSSDYGEAKILPKSEKMIQKRLGKVKRLTVVPGFYGITKQGNIATFERGGSDLTGAYIAASLEAKLYENFTDSAVRTANPEIVSPIIPAKINDLTFSELRDLSYSGFGIFHSESILPLEEKGILTHIRNTFEYPNEGTFVVSERICDRKKPIIGIAYQNGFVSFDIRKTGLNDMLGIGHDLLGKLKERKIPYEIMPGVVDNISIMINQKKLERHDPHYILNDFKKLLGHSKIDFQYNLGLLVVAGKGLKGNRGMAADILSTLAKAEVNIKAISQGSDESCIMYGIDNNDRAKAMNSLFDKYSYLKED
ncbi:MAG: hypothetical protein Q7S33_01065 [Nanoarchaeota archaeon]|nr:hypothetical protein [Nanoarchaeota archaeon]